MKIVVLFLAVDLKIPRLTAPVLGFFGKRPGHLGTLLVSSNAIKHSCLKQLPDEIEAGCILPETVVLTSFGFQLVRVSAGVSFCQAMPAKRSN